MEASTLRFGAVHKYNSQEELKAIQQRLAKGRITDDQAVVIHIEGGAPYEARFTDKYTDEGAVLTANDAALVKPLLQKLRVVRSLLPLGLDAKETETALCRALNIGNVNDVYLQLPLISNQGYREIIDTIKKVAQKEEKSTEAEILRIIG